MLPDFNISVDLSGCSLDHVAVAVSDLTQSKSFYESLGLSFYKEEEVVESEKVKVAFAPIDSHARLELLCPTSEQSSVFQFIQKKGAGLHHLCFLVKDVKLKQLELEKKGIKFIYEKCRDGANNRLINFIHPKSTGGVLIELSQIKNEKV